MIVTSLAGVRYDVSFDYPPDKRFAGQGWWRIIMVDHPNQTAFWLDDHQHSVLIATFGEINHLLFMLLRNEAVQSKLEGEYDDEY